MWRLWEVPDLCWLPLGTGSWCRRRVVGRRRRRPRGRKPRGRQPPKAPCAMDLDELGTRNSQLWELVCIPIPRSGVDLRSPAAAPRASSGFRGCRPPPAMGSGRGSAECRVRVPTVPTGGRRVCLEGTKYTPTPTPKTKKGSTATASGAWREQILDRSRSMALMRRGPTARPSPSPSPRP
jgi:hypothetical protein